MNSDPFDSAAWRTFGMLDSDESAIFDGARRQDPPMQNASLEMDRLSAAIAASLVPPVPPQARHLELLQTRLGLNPSGRRYFWWAFSGWATAALCSLILVIKSTGLISRMQNAPAPPASIDSTGNLTQPVPAPPRPPLQTPPLSAQRSEAKPGTKIETKRLIQEIEVLRENLRKFQDRDRALFQPSPGMALPIVMSMNPPGVGLEQSAAFSKDDQYSPIPAMLGDALTALTGDPGTELEDTGETPTAADDDLTPEYPTAIPIYDAARDSGTLVVSNLAPAADGEVYNLWVATEPGDPPIYVGSLPEASATGADSFDFSLGSTMVLPSGFVLTLDPQDSPAKPTQDNTVLQGPPSS